MAYTKQNFEDGEVLKAKHLNHIENGIEGLFEEIGDLKGSEVTGISAELTGVLRTFFTNIQTLISQMAFTTDEHIGYTLVANAQDIVNVLQNGGDIEQPESGITQTGSVLAITSGVTATQAGSVLAIA